MRPHVVMVGLQEVVDINANTRKFGYAMQGASLDRTCTAMQSIAKEDVAPLWNNYLKHALRRISGDSLEVRYFNFF